jgi:hypothetical protein
MTDQPMPTAEELMAAWQAQQAQPAGPTPEQQAAYAQVASAQTPAELAAAAQRAGLTGDAQALAAAGAAPVQAPSFEEQLAASTKQNAALQAQLQALQSNFASQIQGLQTQVSSALASIPAKVDPVTESATKVTQAASALFNQAQKAGIQTHWNAFASALTSHLDNLGLSDLAKVL